MRMWVMTAAAAVGGGVLLMGGAARPPAPPPGAMPPPGPAPALGPVEAPPPMPAGPREAAPAVAAARAGLRDVTFMEGRWRGVTDGSVAEEHWSAPEGRCMMGMFRWVMPGAEPYMFQLMTLTEEGGGVAMRLREFSPELVAKEEKDQPKVLRLVEVEGERAAFAPEGSGAEGVERVVYERTAPDTLVFSVWFKEEMGRAPFRLELRREGAAAGGTPETGAAEAAGTPERGAE